MNPLEATIAALEDTLRRAELRHKALVASLNAGGFLRAALQEDIDWVPFYAKYLAEEFAGIRLPGLPQPVAHCKTCRQELTQEQLTAFSEWEHASDALAKDTLNDERLARNEEAIRELEASERESPFSNHKWEPVEVQPCPGYGCE